MHRNSFRLFLFSLFLFFFFGAETKAHMLASACIECKRSKEEQQQKQSKMKRCRGSEPEDYSYFASASISRIRKKSFFVFNKNQSKCQVPRVHWFLLLCECVCWLLSFSAFKWIKMVMIHATVAACCQQTKWMRKERRKVEREREWNCTKNTMFIN